MDIDKAAWITIERALERVSPAKRRRVMKLLQQSDRRRITDQRFIAVPVRFRLRPHGTYTRLAENAAGGYERPLERR
jgi:hypothetical protein